MPLRDVAEARTKRAFSSDCMWNALQGVARDEYSVPLDVSEMKRERLRPFLHAAGQGHRRHANHASDVIAQIVGSKPKGTTECPLKCL